LGGQGCRAFSDGLGWLDGLFGRRLGRGRSLRWEIGLTYFNAAV
jgi:hypothetical protein